LNSPERSSPARMRMRGRQFADFALKGGEKVTDNGKRMRVTADFGAVMAPVWIMGWLFTIGFLSLPLWRAVFAVVLWPYYLGVFFR